MALWIRNLFGRKEPVNILHFNSGDAALEYACLYMNCEHIVGALLPAVIQHTWPQDGDMTDLGLYLAATSNPVPQKAVAPSSLGLKPGDFVAFRILAVRPPPAGIFGMTEALLKPSLDVAEGGWLTDRVLFKSKGQS